LTARNDTTNQKGRSPSQLQPIVDNRVE